MRELATGERAASYSRAWNTARAIGPAAAVQRCDARLSGGWEGDSRVALINYVRDESTWYRAMVNAAAATVYDALAMHADARSR